MLDNSFRKVSIIGLGYIGLPTAAMFASRGLSVVGVDVSEHAVNTINSGKIHIVEPDLDMIVHSAVNLGKLKATTTPEAADAFLITVPTPLVGDHEPDLSFIEDAARSIAPVLKRGNLVILESTIPVGTTERLAEWLQEERGDLSFPQTAGEEADVQIAHCPERVLPGQVMQELVVNDRIVGGMTPHCAQRAESLYQVFVKGDCHLTDARTAELAKLTENSFRDVNIAFANELSLICDELDINVWDLIHLSNKHPRVDILSPGPGVGGHCIAVDPWFIVASAPESAKIIVTARDINDNKPRYIVEQIKAAASQFKEPVIACMGLAFKADIDDLRESPSVDITLALAEAGVGRILAVEPNIAELPEGLQEVKVELVDQEVAMEEANIIVALVDHKSFKKIKKSRLNEKVLIDCRGVWN
ncbi:MAG: UDP-N-acetyl-D-mannosamine dehydrogenase [bacterium]|nr:UDP-N-acetyl-D-mannosamine dehydrogenase [Gammaproteobacteria bacterium]HIL96274.1 UDP-N-acetyl-D-mannosamine dehydrogenase [Pseudomonadales bacterium]